MLMFNTVREWSRRKPCASKFLAGLFIVVISIAAFGSWGSKAKTKPTNPFQNLYYGNKNNTKSQCQETIYQPFLVGCPAECWPYREDIPLINETKMYRLTMEWYFGQPLLKLHLPIPQPDTYYDMGYNYQCPKEFVDAFGQASDALETALLQPNKNESVLVITTQTRMHLSLAYLCCLKLEEAYHVREIMQEFVHSKSFFIPNVNFERIECWKERFNSITHIIVVDNVSQQRLLDLLHQLEGVIIQQAGIPVPISRLTQMPFHTTLLGIQRGNTKYSIDPQHDIDPILPLSYQALQHINRDVWPTNGISMFLQHLPKYSAIPVLQAAIESNS